ncbi:TetR/AcrR family transcriptional regulator [Collimonas pratensis]|uniref:Bacterial regulatory s, tetR family protein n=1 Tax=Collimonas pratensis TaxID=279113 RepID=A0A127QA94_9BURK|nr:TetR/AcrR family transcriptional regulator [Collimonas pratensis]AMP06990.1 bacterial regulatory s, tetR family protein [Collimonas pratensis]
MTASELFYAQGIRATGIDAIIECAGVSKSSFYHHFPSKDLLIVAVLHRRDREWRNWFSTTVSRLSPDPAGRPLAVFDALREYFSCDDFRGCAFINSIVESADRHHPVHLTSARHKKQVLKYLAEILESAEVPNAQTRASDFMLLIDGAFVTALREGGINAAKAAKRLAKQLLSQTNN